MKNNNDLLDVIAEHSLSVEIYPNIVYVGRKGYPYIEECVKLSNVGGDIRTAIEIAVEKTIVTMNNWGGNSAAA